MRPALPSQLRCAQCGLAYSWAAVAREVTLSMGIDCRRCGGNLHESYDPPARRAAITAVRSALSTPGRRPFE